MRAPQQFFRFFLLLLFITYEELFCVLAHADAQKTSTRPELTIYAANHLVSSGGFGPEILSSFEKQCGCKVKVRALGSAGQILRQLELDSRRGPGKPAADILWGIDQNLWHQVRPFVQGWEKWRPKRFEKILPTAQLKSPRSEKTPSDGVRTGFGDGFLPFYYGVMCFIADKQFLKQKGVGAVPVRFKDLLEPRFRRNLLLEDPRTSSLGLAFLLYANTIITEKTKEFWGLFRKQWLTLTPDWEGAYGLFLRGEAPLVWSYSTSQAYHIEHGDQQGRYQAVFFEEGQPVQIGGAAWVKGAAHPDLAKQFLEFLLSEEVQRKVPERIWMFPVVEGTPLPPSFRALPVPSKVHSISRAAPEVTRYLDEWSRSVHRVF